MDENKIKFGLSNVHVGTLTETDGEYTFGEPQKYPGAVNLTLDPQGETTPFYADNIVYYTTSTNNGYSGELEVAYLYDWFEQDFLSNVESNEGMIVEVADALPKSMYLMFQFEGDKKATKHIMYNVLPARPNVNGQTREDTTTPTTVTIPITAMPLVTEFGNIVKAKCPSTASNYGTFFTSVPTIPTKKSELAAMNETQEENTNVQSN